MIDIPRLALSVRQPWAWAIVHGKDIENRSWRADNPGIKFRGPFAVHASTGMTRYEYEDARETIERIGLKCPDPAELQRGGIVGVATISGIVRESESPWFFGPVGLVLIDARPVEFQPSPGMLGFFNWKPIDTSYPPAPAKWMRLWGQDAPPAAPHKVTVKADDHPHLSPLERAKVAAEAQGDREAQFDADMALFEREQRQ